MMENTDGNIGRILKQRREELGRTLQNAEEETRIRKTYLESLENNRFSELPGQAYVTGFIRVYARYLGLKSNPLLALLNDQQSVDPEPAETDPAAGSKPVQGSKNPANSDWRKFFLAFLLVLVLGGLTYFLTTIFSPDEPLNESLTTPTATAETPAVSSTPQTGREKSSGAPEIPQTPADEQAQPVKSADLPPALVATPPVASAERQGQDDRKFPAIPSGGASLRMLALADSSLIIKVDDRKPHQHKLYDGLDLTWKIKQRVTVEFAASDVARFWLNGQEIDLTGDQSFTLQTAAE